MILLSPDKIKEIAEQLSCGFQAFLHKKTGELIFIPDTDQFFDMDLEGWEKDLELLENNRFDYYEIEKWSTHEAFDLMADFAEQLSGNKALQNRLITALNKRKPFREFKWEIDNSGEYRQRWFDFRDHWQREYVKEQLEVLGQADE